MTLKIQELPAPERPRSAWKPGSRAALSDSELIAISPADRHTRQEPRWNSAGQLLLQARFARGSFAISVKEICEVKGIGFAKAGAMAAALRTREQRLGRESITTVRIDTPELIYIFLEREMRALRTESLRLGPPGTRS